jgi:hypothetical protein
MTILRPSGRPDAQPVLDSLVLASRQVRQVQRTVEDAEPSQLLEPILFARGADRAAEGARSPILSSFAAARQAVLAWQEDLPAAATRRDRLQAGELGLGLQLDGVRLELAVRLRLLLHPDRMRAELDGMTGVGLRAADRGYALVNEVADGYTKARLTADLWSAMQTSNMVRTLNLLLVANLPDARLDR